MELPTDPSALPGAAAMQGILADLDQMLDKLPETQQQLMSLTGTAWSDDELVKAVVGPRGQLIDVDVDPRLLQESNTQALRASILSAASAAAENVVQQVQELLMGQVPPEVAELRAQFDPDRADPVAQMLMTDTQLTAKGKEQSNRGNFR